MKAVQIEKYSKEIHTILRQIPTPEPGDRDVLIRVKAAAVNPLELLILRGEVKLIQNYSMPVTLGNECSGVVERVGSRVTGFGPGDRVYEDTLAELFDTAKQAGFRVVAAVAAVAEHSIARQFAAGRPDEQDAASLADFAGRIREKLDRNDLSEPCVPGNRPYKKAGAAGLVPKPTKDCVRCGACAKECPVQAIDPANVKKVDKNACISCMRCVSVCPHSARKAKPVMLTAVGVALKKVCSERRECELYL